MTRSMTMEGDTVSLRAEARRQMRQRISHLTWTASAALFGAGVGVSLSILFLSAGVVLMAAGVALAIGGLLAALIVPRFVYY